MNTPKPCDTCENLYYDCVAKDDPSYMAECKLGLPLGFMNCPKYDKYKEEKVAVNQ